MSSEAIDNPRQRIFDAAVALFAKKSYDGVGVREIAGAADVNISMISYYYGGKGGILKSIIDEFHSKYYQAIVHVISEEQTPEDSVRLIIKGIVDFIRHNSDLAVVSFNTLPLDIPEIADIRTEKVKSLIKGVSDLFRRFSLDPDDPLQVIAIGPSILGIVLAHFRLRPVQAQIFGLEFDDSFYEKYAGLISTFCLRGITGIAELNRKQRGDSDENDG